MGNTMLPTHDRGQCARAKYISIACVCYFGRTFASTWRTVLACVCAEFVFWTDQFPYRQAHETRSVHQQENMGDGK